MNNLSNFTQARWREWLQDSGWHETDCPYLWCLDSLARFPETQVSRSIHRFMQAWQIGYDAALREKLEHEITNQTED